MGEFIEPRGPADEPTEARGRSHDKSIEAGGRSPDDFTVTRGGHTDESITYGGSCRFDYGIVWPN